MEDLELAIYCDADFAGCQATQRSTTGAFLCLQGPNSFFPISPVSKRQTCVSNSTPEAEIVAANHALRMEALPALDLWECITGSKTYCRLYEDNAATTSMMISGKTNSLRALNRTHRVSLAWVFEVSNGEHLEVRQIDSANQRADIFTKGFPVKRAWASAQQQIGVTIPNVWGHW